MFIENEVQNELLNIYLEIINCYKSKENLNIKADKLIKLLTYIKNNIDNLKKEDLSVIKNILILSNGMINTFNKKYLHIEISKCLNLNEEITNKLIQAKKRV